MWPVMQLGYEIQISSHLKCQITWNRDLVEKLIVSYLVEKYFPFHLT